MNKPVTCIMIYYYFVCKRKLWYFCHNISMEHTNENVKDEINIDYVRSRDQRWMEKRF